MKQAIVGIQKELVDVLNKKAFKSEVQKSLQSKASIDEVQSWLSTKVELNDIRDTLTYKADAALVEDLILRIENIDQKLGKHKNLKQSRRSIGADRRKKNLRSDDLEKYFVKEEDDSISNHNLGWILNWF